MEHKTLVEAQENDSTYRLQSALQSHLCAKALIHTWDTGLEKSTSLYLVLNLILLQMLYVLRWQIEQRGFTDTVASRSDDNIISNVSDLGLG